MPPVADGCARSRCKMYCCGERLRWSLPVFKGCLASAEANCAEDEQDNDHKADDINDIIHVFSISAKSVTVISVADVSGMVIATTNMDQSG